MKNAIKLTKQEQTNVDCQVNKIRWLNPESTKACYVDATESEITEILRKQTNIMICTEIISTYIEDKDTQERLNELVCDILSELN